jgi:hypothetical protein
MSEQPKNVPVSGPYCSDPTCVYCKELREGEEELRYKTRLAELIDELKKAPTQGSDGV